MMTDTRSREVGRATSELSLLVGLWDGARSGAQVLEGIGHRQLVDRQREAAGDSRRPARRGERWRREATQRDHPALGHPVLVGARPGRIACAEVHAHHPQARRAGKLRHGPAEPDGGELARRSALDEALDQAVQVAPQGKQVLAIRRWARIRHRAQHAGLEEGAHPLGQPG